MNPSPTRWELTIQRNWALQREPEVRLRLKNIGDRPVEVVLPEHTRVLEVGDSCEVVIPKGVTGLLRAERHPSDQERSFWSSRLKIQTGWRDEVGGPLKWTPDEDDEAVARMMSKTSRDDGVI
ncbi:MAG: hypothetical protein AABM40_04575 [Chloroflexota bacterium]